MMQRARTILIAAFGLGLLVGVPALASSAPTVPGTFGQNQNGAFQEYNGISTDYTNTKTDKTLRINWDFLGSTVVVLPTAKPGTESSTSSAVQTHGTTSMVTTGRQP